MAPRWCAGRRAPAWWWTCRSAATRLRPRRPSRRRRACWPKPARRRSSWRAAQGMQADGGERIMHDARALEAAGAFALVVDCTAEAVGRRVTEALGIPVIGIGASPACDGQILVTEDMLGMSGARVPRFVKQYAQ